MRVLFVYSDINCSCTKKTCFQLSVALSKYIETKVLDYKNLTEDIIKKYEIVIFQRLGANGVIIKSDEKQFILNIINKYKNEKKFVYLIDDLLIEDQNGFPKELIKNCNVAMCTNKATKEKLKLYNDKVYVFRTFVDMSLADSIPFNKFDEFTMAWVSTGGLGTNIVIDIVKEMNKLNKKYRLIAMGGGAKEVSGLQNVEIYSIIPTEDMIRKIKGVDILLNPMSISEKTRFNIEKRSKFSAEEFLNCKSEIKYAIAGLANACLISSSYVDSYKYVINNWKDAIMVNDVSNEWINTIKYLYDHNDIMQQIADRCSSRVKMEYDINVVVKDVINILSEIEKI